MRLTSTKFRRDLAMSLQRILAAAGEPSGVLQSYAVAAAPPRVPVRRERISQSAPRLAALASRLVEPGPVPARGVAMVSQLLADGTGPLYHVASGEDLGAIIARAAHALTR